MVRVEGLTDREIALREKTSKLVEITKQFLGFIGSQRLVLSNVGIYIKTILPKL